MAETRDKMGRFVPGSRHALGATGHSPRSAITNAIRRICDPEKIAHFLNDLVHDEKAKTDDRLKAAAMILDRTEGKALSQSVTYSSSTALPEDWDTMAIDERRAFIRSLKSGNA